MPAFCRNGTGTCNIVSLNAFKQTLSLCDDHMISKNGNLSKKYFYSLMFGAASFPVVLEIKDLKYKLYFNTAFDQHKKVK